MPRTCADANLVNLGDQLVHQKKEGIAIARSGVMPVSPSSTINAIDPNLSEKVSSPAFQRSEVSKYCVFGTVESMR